MLQILLPGFCLVLLGLVLEVTRLHNVSEAHTSVWGQKYACPSPTWHSREVDPLLYNTATSCLPKNCPSAKVPAMKIEPFGSDNPQCILPNGETVSRGSLAYIEEVTKSVFGHYCSAAAEDRLYLVDGASWPPLKQECDIVSMAGMRRATNLKHLLMDTIINGVEGDFIEAGVWKGGLCIIAAAVYEAFDQWDTRKIWAADSFSGIPKAITEVDKKHHNNAHTLSILNDNSMERVQTTFKKFDFLDDNKVKWVKGYFSDSFPKTKHMWTKFSVIRLDGDMYESVMDGLVHCVPFLSRGGYVIIDDYTDWIGARNATVEYIAEHKINTTIFPVYHEGSEQIRGAYFQMP